MAPRLTTIAPDEEINRLCKRCRRNCKQTVAAVISTCPRYYPLRTRQVVHKDWQQQDLFGE